MSAPSPSPPPATVAIPSPLTSEQKAELKRRLLSGELDVNSNEAKQIWVSMHKDDPLAFALRTLSHHMVDQGTGHALPSPPFHREMMDLYLNNRFVGIAAPRNHAKSTVTTLFYVIFCIVFQRKKNIVIVSSTEDMAVRFLRRVKDELDTNKFLIWAFGPLRSDKWSETEIRTTTGISVHAKGRGAQLRGLIDGANRPDLVVCDDLEDDELVRSELRRFDFESWFNGTVLPTLAPMTGQVVFVGTILHMDSLLSRIVRKGTDGKSELYPEFETRVYSAIDPETNLPLWPERFSLAHLLKIKDDYARRDQLAQFFMEWMNDPIPQENAQFKVFTFFDPVHDRPDDLFVEMFVDTGGGSVKKGADDTAIVVTGTDTSNTLFVLDSVSDKMGTDTDRIIDEIFRLDALHRPKVVRIEKTMASNFLSSALEKRMINDRHFLNVQYVSPPKGSGDRRGNMSDGKYQRISAMASPMKLGAIRIQRWMTQLLEQLQRFPNAQHDDLADALGYAWSFASRRTVPASSRAYEPDFDELGRPSTDKASDGYVNLYDDIGI